jgi:hypothetical protein
MLRLRWTGFGWASLAIVLLAAALRFWALDFGLPNPRTRPDEAPVVQQVVRITGGDLADSWITYPGGYIYLCWIWGEAVLRLTGEGGYAAVARSEAARVYLTGRSLSAAAGVAAVFLLILVTRRALGDGPALLAGFLLATNFLHARDSHAMKPDALLTLAGLAALAAMLPLARRATLRRAVAAGLFTGGAMAMKYTAVLLVSPLYLAAVLGSDAAGWRRLLPKSVLVAAACAGGVFVATSHYLVFDTDFPMQAVNGLALIFGPRAGGEVLTSGHEPLLMAGSFVDLLAYHALVSFRYGAGLLVALLAPAAVAWGLMSRRSLPLLAAVYCLIFYFVVSMGNQAFARFMSPLMPLIALLEAGMLAAILAKLAPRHVGIGLVLAAALLATEPLAKAVAHNQVIARTDTREQASSWLAGHLVPGTVVAVVGHPPWPFDWGMPHIPGRLDARPEIGLDASAMEAAAVEVLVTHDHPLPFSTVSPRVLAQLEPHLRLLAEFDPFTERRPEAVFEHADAYYVPIHGFAGVERPGPHIRIYAFE